MQFEIDKLKHRIEFMKIIEQTNAAGSMRADDFYNNMLNRQRTKSHK